MPAPVFVFIRTLLKGGAEKQSVLLAKALHDQVQVHLIVLHGEQYSEELLQEAQAIGANLHLLKGNIVSKVWAYHRLIRQHQPRVIFSYLMSNNFLSAVFGKLNGVPHLVGGVRSVWTRPWKFRLLKWLHNQMHTYTIFNNQSGADQLVKQGLDPQKILVIPNVMEVNYNLLKRADRKPTTVVSVGRFVFEKDYPTALDAVSQLVKDFDFRYVIVGYGVLEAEIREHMAQRGLSDVVELVIQPPDVNKYYQEGDIYLSSSIIEGVSNSILEAMSFALPVVATRVGDNARLVEEGKTGSLVEPKDAKALADAVRPFLQDYALRQEQGEAGYRKVKEEFSMERFRTRYLDLLEALPA